MRWTPVCLSDVSFEPHADPGGELFRASVEALAQLTLNGGRFELAPFVRVMQTLPMNFDELFEMYVGKNVLNTFRQNNGYKAGTYRKLWQGQEDNEHLIEALAALECAPEEIPARLYEALELRYRTSAD